MRTKKTAGRRRPKVTERAGAVSVRELSRKTGAVLEAVWSSGRPALITNHGRIVAALVPVDPGDFEDYVLAHARQFVRDMQLGDEELAAGKTRPVARVFADLDTVRRPRRRRPA